MRKLALLGIVIGLVAVRLAAGPVSAAERGDHAVIDQLSLVDGGGAPYQSPETRSPVTLVGIWATWCPSCREDLPALIGLANELESDKVRLLLVSVDRVPERGVRHLARIGYQGEAAFDPGAKSVARLGIRGIPTVLVLDGSGHERDRIIGAGRESTARIRASALKVMDGSERAQARSEVREPKGGAHEN